MYLQRQIRPHQQPDIDHRGEGRFEHESLHLALQRQTRCDSRAERLAVSDDVVRRHAEAAQIVVGADRIRRDSRLGRTPARAAIATVVEHEHAVAVAADRLDLVGAVSGTAAIAAEIEQRRLAGLRRPVPRDEPRTVCRLEHDLLDAWETGIARCDPRPIRHIDESSDAAVARRRRTAQRFPQAIGEGSTWIRQRLSIIVVVRRLDLT